MALPKVDAPSRASRANAVNYDGSVIVGWDDANNGQRRGVQWRNGAPSLIRRGTLSVGEALDVSRDGQYIIGQSNSATNYEAWLWSQPSGVQLLGALPGQDAGLTGALSDDASVITGQALDFEAGTITPTIWTSGLGLTDFNQFLSAQGVVTTGLGMRLGMAMSADGRTITGYANGPYGYVGWVLKTPTSLVCHASQQGPSAVETLAVAFPQGLNEHLGHGDTLGPCPCVDVDGDGFTTCGVDCNDNDPAVHPGASDANCNGIDDDCDGIVDVERTVGTSGADDGDGSGRNPVVLGRRERAAAYDVFAGDLKELLAHAATSVALAGKVSEQRSRGHVDVGRKRLPAPGDGRWYLVRAVNCAGAGTYDGASRPERFARCGNPGVAGGLPMTPKSGG